MEKVKRLLSSFSEFGASEVFDASEIVGEKILYCITNGPNILTIGQGKNNRLRGLLRGRRCTTKHKKNFVIAASNKVHGSGHRYFYLATSTPKETENSLHREFGKIYLHDQPDLNVNQSSTWLFDQIMEKVAKSVSTNFVAALEVASLEGDALPVLYRLEKYKHELDLAFNGYFI